MTSKLDYNYTITNKMYEDLSDHKENITDYPLYANASGLSKNVADRGEPICPNCDSDLIAVTEEEKVLSEIQKEYLIKGCPECGGTMHEVESPDSEEIYLWCNSCDVSMDSDGGVHQLKIKH